MQFETKGRTLINLKNGLTTAEEIARCWNGGPRGMDNDMTAGYWKKVQKNLDS